jgi:glycosyltransferase involved in cell wall biosynthesis
MTSPLVTIGVPVYGGQDLLPILLDCLRTQTYKNIEVLVSVDGADQASAEACKPFLREDSRFRMHIQPSRLGWAGNTDWTMRQRRGDFYVYQQHDDLLSPDYIAELVEASARWPNAVICFSKMHFMGQERSAPSLLGDRNARILRYLHRLDFEPFRGLIRGSALDNTSGLLLSNFDPFDSLGTEFRFMAELAILGEFRFVEGPTYFKSWHGKNLSAKREGWSLQQRITAKACWAAWMIEVIAASGASVRERRELFKITLERFAGRRDPFSAIRPTLHGPLHRALKTLPLRMIRDYSRKREELAEADLLRKREELAEADLRLDSSVQGTIPASERRTLLRQILEMLKSGGRFEPRQCINMSWEALEAEMLSQYGIR